MLKVIIQYVRCLFDSVYWYNFYQVCSVCKKPHSAGNGCEKHNYSKERSLDCVIVISVFEKSHWVWRLKTKSVFR